MPHARAIVSMLGVTAAFAVLTGCAGLQSYDGVLWRQIRGQQEVAFLALQPGVPATDAADIAARLSDVVTTWDGSEPPPAIPTTAPASVVYAIEDVGDDGLGGAVVEFTEFVTSGARPDVPRDDLTNSAITYRGPSTVYTCYRWRVVLVAGSVGDAQKPDYASGDDPACDPRLVAQLPEDAAHIPTSDLTG